MAVRSLRNIPVRVWIPPTYHPIYKIEIHQSASPYTIWDITDDIYEGEVTDGVTETIGSFSFTIDNSRQQYSDKFVLYDTIRIKMNYATTATTVRFGGVIEKISHRGPKIILTGRSMAARLMGTTVTQSFSNEYTHDIVQSLFTTYFSTSLFYSGDTYIDTSTATDTRVSVDWYQKPFWECIKELCNIAGYDAYINSGDIVSETNYVHYFVSGSRTNTTEAVVHESNLIETGDFTPDLSVVKNRIIVYGAKVEDMQIVWTEEDVDSILKYDVKEKIINDSNIRTTAQAKERAVYELNLHKDPPIIGEVTSLGLPTLAPGEKVRISDPFSGLDPNYYTIQKYTHKFSNEQPMMTTLSIKKEMTSVSQLFKSRIVFEKESVEMENPNELRYSWIDTFDSDSGVHSNTEITDGVLKLQSGQSSGTWISGVNNLSSNATVCELRIKGESLSGTDYWISVDNGINYQKISLNRALTLSPPGTNLKIKIDLNSSATQIDSMMLLYKT